MTTIPHDFQIDNDQSVVPEGNELSSICEIDGWLALCHRLHNGRPKQDFLRIYRRDGCPEKARNTNPKRTWETHSQWAWDTIVGKCSVATSIGFYSQSLKTGKTCWGCLDYDLHGRMNDRGAVSGVFSHARAAFHRMADENSGAIVIFESSGQGFHVWLILRQQIPVSTMHANMVKAASGVKGVEIIPSPRVSTYGKAVRAPGTWNPAVDGLSMILGVAWTDGSSNIPHRWLSNLGANLPERGFLLSLFFQASADSSPAVVSQPQTGVPPECVDGPEVSSRNGRSEPDPPKTCKQLWEVVCDLYQISSPNTRHKMLTSMVGGCFYQFAPEVVRKFAELQFDSKNVKTEASKEQHLEEANAAIHGMEKQWLSKHAKEKEAEFHNNLKTENQRAAFRILHNFAKYAERASDEEFFVSHKVLAERLQISRQGASNMLNFFEGKAIMKTRSHTFKRACRYKWLFD